MFTNTGTNKRELTREKANVTLRVDKLNWDVFKTIMKDLKINTSEWFDEMMRRTIDVGIQGGEVIFGIKEQKAYVASGAHVHDGEIADGILNKKEGDKKK